VTAVVLKRLDFALQDGDPIRAVIRATAINQDGRTQGITVPSQRAQVKLIHKAYQMAGLDPRDTAYVEAHGMPRAFQNYIRLSETHCGL
jgi:acyl transferase domain-containing protein